MPEPEAYALQRPVDTLSDEVWDVVVVGAGPGGATAAIHLAARGHRVLLVDKAQFPREKVCGDGLVPGALRSLGRAGVWEAVRARGHTVDTLRVFSPSRVDFNVPVLCVMLRRRILDALIVRRAAEVGAVVAQGTVNSVAIETDGSVTCAFLRSSKICRARVGVIATGASVRLMAKLVRAKVRPKVGAVAIRCYVRSSCKLDEMVISYDRSLAPGYAWIFPMGDNEYNMGCGAFRRSGPAGRADLTAMFRSFVSEFPVAREVMQRGEPTSPMRGGALRCGLETLQLARRGPVLGVGETIGTTLPFLGEGIGKAMESGELAAQVIHDALSSDRLDKLAEYPARLRDELAPGFAGYRTAEKWLGANRLTDFLASRARKSRWLNHALAGIVAGTADPKEAFSPLGVLRSYWR